MQNLLGPNWKVRLSGFLTIAGAVLTVLSGLSYDMGPLALIIPPDYKPTVLWISGLATTILWGWNQVSTKSKDSTGGTVPVLSTGLPDFFINNDVRKPIAEATPEELAQIKSQLGLTQ